MTPKVSEKHVEARRQQILDAAFACFARKGFHQTTMQEICRAAGLSPGAVYSYFHSKEEIIEASCQECQLDLLLIEGTTDRLDTLGVFNELVDIYFGRLAEAAAESAIQANVQIWSEALRNHRIKESLRLHEEKIRQALEDLIGGGQEQGQINPALSAQASARVMMAMWHGLVLQKALHQEVDVSSYTDVVKALIGGTFWQGEAGED
ncbi:MAG: TetR/AcrR family transcriptional regulator [Dehalococcoidia bacterium]